MERVLAIHREVKDSALAEEYIEGREFFVGDLGNQDAVAFPPIEMDFSGLPEGAPMSWTTRPSGRRTAPNSPEPGLSCPTSPASCPHT
jgi:hypothetical protein